AEATTCMLWNPNQEGRSLLTLVVLYAAAPALLQWCSRERLFAATFAAQPLVAVALPLVFGYRYSLFLAAWCFLPIVAISGAALGWYLRNLEAERRPLPGAMSERAPTSPAL